MEDVLQSKPQWGNNKVHMWMCLSQVGKFANRSPVTLMILTEDNKKKVAKESMTDVRISIVS